MHFYNVAFQKQDWWWFWTQLIPVYFARRLFVIPRVCGSIASYRIFDSSLLSWLIQSSILQDSFFWFEEVCTHLSFLVLHLEGQCHWCCKKDRFLPVAITDVSVSGPSWLPVKNLPSNYFPSLPGCDSSAWVHFNKTWWEMELHVFLARRNPAPMASHPCQESPAVSLGLNDKYLGPRHFGVMCFSSCYRIGSFAIFWH